MENDILKHRMAVISNIEKSFGEDIVEKGFEDEVNPFEYAEWENSLTKAELDEFEKAKHQDGDMHPNGKWVWRASANGGKGDWRVANPKRGGSKATAGGASTSTPSSGSTGPLNTSSSYFSKLSNSLIEKYSKKKESVSLSDIEEFYEDYLRDRGQEPTRKAYANEAKKTYDAIVGNWNKKSSNTESSDNVNKLKLNGVDITVKRDPKDKYGYIVEGNGKSVKTQDPSFYNVTKLTGLTKKTIADMLDIPLKTTAKKKTDDKNTSSASNEVSVKDVKAIETFPDLDEDKYLKRGNKVLKEYTLSVNINGKKIEGTTHEFWASNTLSNTSVGGFETTVYIGSGFPLDKRVKTLEEAKSLFLSTVKKKLESKTYSSDSADAYDKGDGKIGNYPKPTVNVGKPARQLYNLLDKNRHFRFKYGMPSDEIMKKLKTYQGNVVYSYHNNAGTDEIYRIEFK